MGVHLGWRQLSFTSTELKGTTGHLIGTTLQGIRNTGTGVKRSLSKKSKVTGHRGGDCRKGGVFSEWLLREKTKGLGSGREGDSFPLQQSWTVGTKNQEPNSPTPVLHLKVSTGGRMLLSVTWNLQIKDHYHSSTSPKKNKK